jgi:hypothetical protein
MFEFHRIQMRNDSEIVGVHDDMFGVGLLLILEFISFEEVWNINYFLYKIRIC